LKMNDLFFRANEYEVLYRRLEIEIQDYKKQLRLMGKQNHYDHDSVTIAPVINDN
jgi:hypothetical protein